MIGSTPDEELKSKDKDIRRVLRMHLHHQNESSNALIVNEFVLGIEPARVDVALITDEYLVGFEIKSASDRLTRLQTQVPSYGKVFDRMVLVVDRAHIAAAQTAVPHWWGIAVAEPQGKTIIINILRKSHLNPNIDAFVLATLLWKDEALEELQKIGLDHGVRSKTRKEICLRLSQSLPLDDLRRVVRDRVRDRGNWRDGKRHKKSRSFR